MFFKNVMVYQVTKNLGLSAVGAVGQLAELLAVKSFNPCGSQDSKKMGWVPPLHACEGEDMVLAGSGRVLFTLKTETKIMPGASVAKLLNTRVKAVEKAEDRKVKGIEKRQFKDEIIKELLPKCLVKENFLSGYLVPGQNLLVLDTASANQGDEFTAYLRETLGGLPIVPAQSNTSFGVTMTQWLKYQEPPEGFLLGENTKLEDHLGSKAAFKAQDLFTDEIKSHLEAGKTVKEIGLVDVGTLAFTLTDDLYLKGLTWSGAFKARAEEADIEDPAARMDADFALMAGELDKVLLQLFEVMNIERQWDEVPADYEPRFGVGFVSPKKAGGSVIVEGDGVESVTIISGEHSVTVVGLDKSPNVQNNN